MSYQKRLDQEFENVPVLPLDDNHIREKLLAFRRSLC